MAHSLKFRKTHRTNSCPCIESNSNLTTPNGRYLSRHRASTNSLSSVEAGGPHSSDDRIMKLTSEYNRVQVEDVETVTTCKVPYARLPATGSDAAAAFKCCTHTNHAYSSTCIRLHPVDNNLHSISEYNIADLNHVAVDNKDEHNTEFGFPTSCNKPPSDSNDEPIYNQIADDECAYQQVDDVAYCDQQQMDDQAHAFKSVLQQQHSRKSFIGLQHRLLPRMWVAVLLSTASILALTVLFHATLWYTRKTSVQGGYSITQLSSDAYIQPTLASATTRLPSLQRLVSAKYVRSVRVKQLKNGRYGVSVLSVSSSGQLLVGELADKRLYVYWSNGSQVTSLSIQGNDTIMDAAWTPCGNIVCTIVRKRVMIFSLKGALISQTKMADPRFISLSPNDDVIYIVDWINGIFWSVDNGLTWNIFLKRSDRGWGFIQALRVTAVNHTNDLWTIEKTTEKHQCRLRVYTVDTMDKSVSVTWRDVTLPTHASINLQFSRLSYDKHTASVFLADISNASRAVHVWSVSGQYDRQLFSRENFTVNDGPVRLTVDKLNHDLFYVGRRYGIVGVYALQYAMS